MCGYDPELKKYPVDGFSRGFDIGNSSPASNLLSDNSHSLNDSMVQVRQKLNKEIQEGRMAGPFDDVQFENFQVSALALRPKKTPGEFRLLHNLSYPYNETSINAQISAEDKHVKYASINDAIKKILSLPRGTYAAKTDVARAFKLIPVKPEQYHLIYVMKLEFPQQLIKLHCPTQI